MHIAAAAILMATTGAPAAAQSVKAGIEAWQRGDHAAAVAIWKPLAERGDADAAFNLGQAYRLGRGVSVNLPTAHRWFDRAARKGHVDAQATLGLLLFQSGNQTGGMRWLKLAAEAGEARAQLIYGTALYNGDGVPRNAALGYAFVSRAAAQGLPSARETLAEMDKALSLADREEGARLAEQRPARSSPAPKPAAKSTTPAKVPARPSTRPPQMAGAAPSSGPWRIQLGAFSQRSSAEALFGRLSRNPELYGKLPFYVSAGKVIRLQVGPFESRNAAERACRAVAQACFPVTAK